MSDRLDVLLSARLDDELTGEERVELEGLLEERPEYAERARAFDEVETRLKSVAEQSAEDEGLTAIYDGLRTRLGFDDPVGANELSSVSSSSIEEVNGIDGIDGINGISGAGGIESTHGKTSLLGRSVMPLFLAAAAAILFYLVRPVNPTPNGEPASIAGAKNSGGGSTTTGTTGTTGNAGLDADLEDELVLVLGYGDEMSGLDGITSDDLDVIEQLDLLDFLSTQDLAVDEMEDRG